MTPCFVERLSFLVAAAMPRLRRITSAASMSPFASTSAFLHSIMPAPVRSRSALTICAVISGIVILSVRAGLEKTGRPQTATARSSELPVRVSAAWLCQAGSDCLFDRGRLATRSLAGRRFGFASGQALRHQLFGVLGIEIMAILFRRMFGRALIFTHNFLRREFRFGGERLAFNDCIRNLGREQADGAQRVVIAGDNVIDFVGIAVG